MKTESTNIALKVVNISKSFTIPTEKKQSVKDYFTNPFSTTTNKTFNALKNVSFEINKGEFVGIIGRNGSGKSTLLKLIAGIYYPDKGRIKFSGKIVPFLELGVGFNPELSGRENIFLNGSILGMSRKFLKSNFEKIVEFAELEKFIDLPLKNYSSGMQVRLAFSIAIMVDADIYLLDEILAVGDANFQLKCFDVLKRLKKNKKTILFVSHSDESIKKFCNRAMYIEDSKLKYDGNVDKALTLYHGQNINIREAEREKLKFNSNLRWGSGEVTLSKIELLSEDGSVSNMFEYGDSIDIKLKYKINKKVNLLNVGIGIYNEKDHYVMGLLTTMDKVSVDISKDSIIIVLKKINLLTGNYYINCVLFADEEQSAYDWIGKAVEFEVFGSPKYRGIVMLDHNWNQ